MDKDFQKLLTRFVNGECNAEERRRVNLWYKEIADRNIDIPDEDATVLRQKILSEVRKKLQFSPARRPVSRFLTSHSLKVAAVIGVMLIVAGLWAMVDKRVLSNTFPGEKAIVSDETVYRNDTGRERVFDLPDGSTVKLYPSSQLRLRRAFDTGTREVHLLGRAFFQVKKDPSRPFYVYSGRVATQVLGTSFVVDAPEGAAKVEVKVMTGRVSVFQLRDDPDEGDEDIKDRKAHYSDSVILSPNQKVEFFVKEGHWITGLVDDPVPVKTLKDTAHSFVFANTEMEAVLREINERFAVGIEVKDDRIYNCTFTGDVSSLSLFDLLDIICTSIGASYSVEGTHILLNGKGCE